MTEKQVVDLGALLDAMARGGQPPSTEELAQLAEAVGKMFHADPDEVAILAISPKNKSLKFVIPEKLSVVGSIPLTSTSALAARTVRERKTEMANNFNTSRHASVFEGVPLGRRESGPDFTSKDLQTLTSLSSTLEKFLKLCPVE